jgi:ribosome biogenesis GTPase
VSAKLNEYGWDSSWAEAFEPHAAAGLEAGRVVVQERGRLLVRTENQVVEAVTAGALRHRARCADELPAVGDWVALDGSSSAVERRVRAILPRRSKLSRKVAGTVTAEQLVAANVDVVLVVMGLDGDYSVRRLERFLVMAWESGARPLVVLNKVDRCDDWVERCEEVGGVAPGVAVVAMSALEGRLDDLLDQ